MNIFRSRDIACINIFKFYETMYPVQLLLMDHKLIVFERIAAGYSRAVGIR